MLYNTCTIHPHIHTPYIQFSNNNLQYLFLFLITLAVMGSRWFWSFSNVPNLPRHSIYQTIYAWSKCNPLSELAAWRLFSLNILFRLLKCCFKESVTSHTECLSWTSWSCTLQSRECFELTALSWTEAFYIFHLRIEMRQTLRCHLWCDTKTWFNTTRVAE